MAYIGQHDQHAIQYGQSSQRPAYQDGRLLLTFKKFLMIGDDFMCRPMTGVIESHMEVLVLCCLQTKVVIGK